MKKTVGFIGLGIMGLPQAINIVKAGYEVIGYNRSRLAVEKFVAAGGHGAESVAEVAKNADIIFTMLPNWPEVKEIALGADGVSTHAKAGAIFVDMSSIAPAVAIEIHDELAAKGIRMLDAPVSGGEPKAIDGTLSVMVGGDVDVLEEALPYIKPMAGTVTRIGAIGAGNVCKLCNQIVVALNITAVGEALSFAAKAGVDPDLVFQAIRGGLAGSAIMENKAPMMLKGDFRPGGILRYHVKDLGNVLATSRKINMPMPFTALAAEVMEACLSDDLELSDNACLVRYFEKIGNVSVCDPALRIKKS